jgi:pimeloyl-ACP methyl ester carboxylesterase
VPIPYSWTTIKGMFSGKRTRMFEEALKNTDRAKQAAIPVERICGPILLVSFRQDQVWPSTLMATQIAERLQVAKFGFYYEHAAYDAGHSEWRIAACRTNMIRFLEQRIQTPAP